MDTKMLEEKLKLVLNSIMYVMDSLWFEIEEGSMRGLINFHI